MLNFPLPESPRSPHQVACGERDIQQGRVLGDGEDSGSGDEEKTGKRMMGSKEKIPVHVLKEIFPKKLHRSLASERVYSHLKQMILSGKVKKGQRLVREEFAHTFNVSETIVAIAFSRLKKDGLIIIEAGVGSIVAQRFK